MKIIGIGGSLRPDSYSYQILNIALDKIERHDFKKELVDLRELKLPFCTGEAHYPDFPDVEHLRRQVRSVAGILIVTPEYHGSLSGVLKNTLDLLSEDDIRGKVVGIIAILGGVHSNNAINTLRLICRHLHCWVLPDQVVIPHIAQVFTDEGKLKDPMLEERIEQFIHHLVVAARQLGS